VIRDRFALLQKLSHSENELIQTARLVLTRLDLGDIQAIPFLVPLQQIQIGKSAKGYCKLLNRLGGARKQKSTLNALANDTSKAMVKQRARNSLQQSG